MNKLLNIKLKLSCVDAHLDIYAHVEKISCFFTQINLILYLTKLNQNLDCDYTFCRLIWYQMEFRLLLNEWEKCNFNQFFHKLLDSTNFCT